MIGALVFALLFAPQAQPAESLHAFLANQFADIRADFPDSTYVAGFADLNGDGRDEALVSLHSGFFCGSGGCALYIYTPAGDSWRQIDELTIVSAPVRLLATRSHGWRDLAVSVRGGGMDMPREVRIGFDGRSYSGNPSLAPRLRGRVSGRVVIADGTEGRRLFE